MDTPTPRTRLTGSYRPVGEGARLLGPLGDDEQVAATLVLRRRGEAPDPTVRGLSTEQLGDRYGADPAEVDAVQKALTDAGIDIVQVDAATRRIRISGPAARINALLGIHLQRSTGADGSTFRHCDDDVTLADPLAGRVTAVLGLDDRPQARAHSRRAAAASTSYTPPQVAAKYDFPDGDGSGQHLAIIELGGGFRTDDLQAYFSDLEVPLPQVAAVGVDGATNDPGTDTDSDGEVMLDIEVAGSLAPRATVTVYFAPNSDAGFLDAIAEATRADPAPTAMSISWGQSEDQWSATSRTSMDDAIADAAARGTTVAASAGDSGSSEGESDGAAHVDFPASSPHALGCGGTRLPSSGAETVWNDGSSGGATGGGVSDVFALPSWQTSVGVPDRSGGGPGRGVPDVAGDADPDTGYRVRVDGQSAVFGGTSAVAPLWAALVCRLAQGAGTSFGMLQPQLYAGVGAGAVPAGFHDITAGDNGAYSAVPGWDACTGLGTPIGTALAGVLSAGS
ncbi:S53 family peptidase [Microbacterium sp. KR10-403]|uniref:S53 family peptidase n=1 Tax=Microbacterium sp. KR10-403 TaxID=3158581 RepID=UPI0032E4823E